MINGFSQQSATSADLQIAGYLECVDDFTADAVEESCRAFRRGEVVGCDPRFLPSSAQFTMRVKETQMVIDYRRRPALPKPMPAEESYSPPASAEKMQALTDALHGRRSWESLAEEYGKGPSA